MIGQIKTKRTLNKIKDFKDMIQKQERTAKRKKKTEPNQEAVNIADLKIETRGYHNKTTPRVSYHVDGMIFKRGMKKKKPEKERILVKSQPKNKWNFETLSAPPTNKINKLSTTDGKP